MNNNDAVDGPMRKKRRTREVNSNSKQTSEVIHNGAKNKVNGDATIRKQHPAKFRLKTSGDAASLSTEASERVPLMLTDVQHLLLHSLLGNLNLSQPPRWYTLERCGKITQTTCLVVEGLSIKHWEAYPDEFVYARKVFSNFVEVLTPSVYNGSLVQELALVPLSEVEKELIIQKYGSMNLALEARKDLMIMMRAMFPIDESTVDNNNGLCKDKFSRTQLIASTWQMIEEQYPVPLNGKLRNAYSDYVLTKDTYAPVNPNSPLFGLDCEMCMTSTGLELTRVSVVNENHETVYESFVKPHNNITDYLTRYSGITESLLEDVTKRLEDVQKDLRELLPSDAILVGQSLNSDLHALKMMHPYIIDTSLIFNFTGERTRKPKLKTLAREFLHEDIQTGKMGHCSVEDSLASLKLVQLKLSRSIEYGDAVHTNREKYKLNIKKLAEKEFALNIFNHVIEQKKTSLVIGCDDITGDYHTYLTRAKETFSSQLKKGNPKKVKLKTMDSPDEVISTLQSAVNEYNFVMAHLKLDVTENNVIEELKKVDMWVEQMWGSVSQSALCVVIFGGTITDDGMAMVAVKN